MIKGHLKKEQKFKVAILFTGSRDKTVLLVKTGETADTSLYGLNHIPNADHFTVGASTLLAKTFRSLLIIPKLMKYDFVIAQDDLILGYLVSLLADFFHLRMRWIYLAMNSSTLMRRHNKNPVRRFLLKKFWSSYASIICLSNGQLEDFVRFGISRDKLVFVPFGVDVDFFQSVVYSHYGDLIVSVGRDSGRDYETLFKAAERVNHSFVVVASTKNIPVDRPVPPNVSVLYDLSLDEVRSFYKRARLVVVVSKNIDIPDGSDCSGQTVILDALAAGRMVITTKRPWITDYFIPNQDLVLIEPNDPETLSKEIKTLWFDSRRREQISKAGHDKVSTKYTTQIFGKNLLRVMSSLARD